MRKQDSVCEICDHNMFGRCAFHCDCFYKIRSTEECDQFDVIPDDDDDEDDDDEEIEGVIDCPRCGGNAYWVGSGYECDDCGWCS